MGGDITRRNLIHAAGLAALGLSLHFEFRELPECLLVADTANSKFSNCWLSNSRSTPYS